MHLALVRSRPDARSVNVVPFSEDLGAQRFVKQHPDGATLEQVGAYLGVTRERVRQIESKALPRLLRYCKRAGISPEDVASYFASRSRNSSTDHMDAGAGAGGATASAREPDVLELGFGAELGQRLEAALVGAETRVAVLERAFVLERADIRPAVRARLASYPDGVRAHERRDETSRPLERPRVDWSEHAGAAPAWTSWAERPEQPSPRAHVAPPITKETTMGAPKTFLYQGKHHTISELLALPEADKTLTPAGLYQRLVVRGRSLPEALTTPMDGAKVTPARAKPSKPPPVPKKAKREDAPPASDAAPAATPSSGLLDPAELLAQLGFRIEPAGRSPRGRLFLLVEASEA